MSRVEAFAAEMLWKIAEEVPPEWYGGDLGDDRAADGEALMERRSRVRELIGSFRESDREPFPVWGRKVSVVVPAGFGMLGDVGGLVM